MNLKILTALGDLYIETNNPKEALQCYIQIFMHNPLSLFALKKFLSFASVSEADKFVQLVCKKITDELSPADSGPLIKLIQAHNLAREPKNFPNSTNIFFDLRICKMTKHKQTNTKDNSVTVYCPPKVTNDSGTF